MCAPALLVLPKVTLPKLPSPMSFKISNLSSRHTAVCELLDQPRYDDISYATVIIALMASMIEASAQEVVKDYGNM